jgi:hypothetical protein
VIASETVIFLFLALPLMLEGLDNDAIGGKHPPTPHPPCGTAKARRTARAAPFRGTRRGYAAPLLSFPFSR